MMRNRTTIVLILFLLFCALPAVTYAEDGYRLWQRYDLVKDAKKLKQYQGKLQQVVIEGNSPTLTVIRQELQQGLQGLLGNAVAVNNTLNY